MTKLFICFAALSALALSGCSEEDTAAPPSRPVRTVTAHVQALGETVTQIGEVQPRHETAMSFRIDGQLLSRLENGSEVKAGDVVARIDETPAKNNVLTAKAELATAKATFDLATVTAQRNRDLFAKSVASRAQLQEAEANLETAAAKVEAATAALANAQENLSYTVLRAPRDGVISALGANEGQVVAAGNMVVTLISDAQRDAVFDVPEKFVTMDIAGASVEVRLVSDPTIVARGAIREVTPAADAATRTYRVKVSLDPGSMQMPFGAAVVGSVVLSPQKLVELPASSLTDRDGQTAVFVFNSSSGKLEYRTVQVERYANASILVRAGVAEGDLVAVAGVSKLRDGESVRLESEDAK